MVRDLADIRPLLLHPDNRGTVAETYRASWGVPPVLQMTATHSKKGTFRGMHFHRKQYDVWTFLSGRAIVYLYDPFLGRAQKYISEGLETIVIPPFVAHGAFSLTPTLLLYGLTEEYSGTDEYGFSCKDPIFPLAREIPPIKHISERDLNAKDLEDFLAEQDELDLADSPTR